MIDVRLTFDSVFLVFYSVVDTSDEMRSMKYFYPDIVFNVRDDAQRYVDYANEHYQLRKYEFVELPIYTKL